MNRTILSILLVLLCNLVNAQTLHSKSIGNPKNQPIIFIHGGPGSNSASFEATTARKLSEKGFYVIFYDRRGEGRSTDTNAKFTFEQTFADLNAIYKKYNIKKANLIAFSFGGIVTTLYAQKYPDHVKSIVLVSSLLSSQETYKTILQKAANIYRGKNDTVHLKQIALAEQMDHNSYQFRYQCFQLASQNGFFNTPHLNNAAKKMYAALQIDTLITNLPVDTGKKASFGFWKHEHYTTMNMLPFLKDLQKQNIKIVALYGKNDGLYSTQQMVDLKKLTGEKYFMYLDNCAHYLYIDQQDQFLNALTNWLIRPLVKR